MTTGPLVVQVHLALAAAVAIIGIDVPRYPGESEIILIKVPAFYAFRTLPPTAPL